MIIACLALTSFTSTFYRILLSSLFSFWLSLSILQELAQAQARRRSFSLRRIERDKLYASLRINHMDQFLPPTITFLGHFLRQTERPGAWSDRYGKRRLHEKASENVATLSPRKLYPSAQDQKLFDM
jgi:hypothetical protein